MDQACCPRTSNLTLSIHSEPEGTGPSKSCHFELSPMESRHGQTGQPAVSEDSAQSLERCEETTHGAWSDASDTCLERQFASHTDWLQLLASRPAFLARLDLRALARLSSALDAARLAVDSAATDAVSEVEVSRGSCSRRGSTWESLPLGISCGVFSRLSPDSAAAARLASVSWSKQLPQSWVQLRPNTLPPKSWASTFCNLRSLDLRHCREYRLSWEDARHLTGLKELRLPGNTSDEELQSIRRVRSLTVLNLSRCYDVSAFAALL